MTMEIERKFLVCGDGWQTDSATRFTQGYLARERDYSVRVRLTDHDAWLCVKGSRSGLSRAEYEYPVPLEDGHHLLALCPRPWIDKIRHEVVMNGFVWEVDEFLGDNQGLVVAEIELDSPDQDFPTPTWLGAEISNDPRYLNVNLARNPYRFWNKTHETKKKKPVD